MPTPPPSGSANEHIERDFCSDARLVCLFDLNLYVPSKIFQLNRDGSSEVEPVLS